MVIFIYMCFILVAVCPIILALIMGNEHNRSTSACVLPNHPNDGIYRINDVAKYIKYIPGSIHESLVVLNATCYPGFKLVGKDLLLCNKGIWSSDFPKCARTCKLERSQSVEYRCITGDERYVGTRECEEYEVEGTMIQPECRKPNYYSSTYMHYMLCHNGEWNYEPRCEPECGTLTPHAQPLVLGGRVAEWGEVPWHAGIYSKRYTPPTQICGASLLSETVLVSAAHCFWFSEHTEPAEDYAVAVGKLYREWGHPSDLEYEQISDVKSNHVSRYYRGATMNYQRDIAIIVVSQPFSYRPYIRPLCINFPQNFNDMLLKNGDIGKVAGWGLTTVFSGSESPKLKVLDLPYIDFDECLNKTPGYYQDYYSGDKICGGFTNGTSLCKGDSGGGFAFPIDFNGRTRYFLRGIVSTSPPLPGGFSCNNSTLISFTDVLTNNNKNFIMMHLPYETSYNDAKVWRRLKREPECGNGSSDFQCTDGTCISVGKKCDGTVDCPDGSDEKYHICRNMRCPYHYFRCTYGACVDRTASCNGVSECADDSDELQPACRNDNNIMGYKFKCDNGELIELYQRCDGTAECSDSTDERLATCASIVCPSHLFQCAYGACVNSGADCNNLQECADGSDESDLLCNRTSVTTTTSTTTKASPSACVLPNHPNDGIYRMTDGAKYIKYIPGSVHESLVVLNATCDPGFKLVGEDLLFCNEGIWSSDFPKCARDERYGGTRECEEYEIEGTMIQPECRKPNYYSSTDLHYMMCHNGEWNYEPRCEPECGTLTPHAQPLVLGGRVAEWGEVPWHAGIYSKRYTPPTQICGSSLLSETVLVSAAHCFWFSEHTQPAEDYAVAAGKLYREWGHPSDLEYEQISDVKSVFVSHYYRGATLNYQHDIAIIVVSKPFSYRPYIRPLCIKFPENFDDMLLKNGDIGKVAGWGLTTVFSGSESPKLKVLDMPYIDFDECLDKTPGYYQDYYSGDKICGGFTNGTSLCKGDSGGGFAFPIDFNGRTRYFLRGIVSTSPPLPGGFSCNIYTLASFTDVFEHKNFIMMHLP